MSLNQHGATTMFNGAQQVSYDAYSVGTQWGFMAEVEYEVKDAGTVGVRYYLSALPTAKPKNISWSTLRHEMKLFFATNADHAFTYWKCGANVSDDFILSTLPKIKNGTIVSTKIELIQLTPSVARSVALTMPAKPEKTPRKKAAQKPLFK